MRRCARAFTQACTYSDGTKVSCAAMLDIEGGKIVRQTAVQATKGFARFARSERISDASLSEAVRRAERGSSTRTWAAASSSSGWRGQARAARAATGC